MKKIILSMGIAFSGIAMAQTTGHEGRVGITTTTPMATLDIEANGASKLNGILIPRVTKVQAETMGSGIGTNKLQESTMVYISNATAGATTKYTSKVDAKGFYYFDGNEWVKVGSGAATSSTQNWEDIRYLTTSDPNDEDGKQVITSETTNGQISNKAWFVVVDVNTQTSVRLPKLTEADAGRMIVIYKKGTGNTSVLDHNGLGVADAGTLIVGTTVVTSARGKSVIWDGKNWYPASY